MAQASLSTASGLTFSMRSAIHVHPVRDSQASNKKASPFWAGLFLFKPKKLTDFQTGIDTS